MASDSAIVLVADDDADIRRLVRVALARRGYRVVEAKTGDSALELALRLHPRVAFLDHDMPGLSGLEVAEALADHPAVTGTRVILSSGRIGPDGLTAHRRRGVHVYLPKPFSIAALQTLVAALVREGDDVARSA
jgi:two-component system, OmpR family, KDP operon response regulator KdpE